MRARARQGSIDEADLGIQDEDPQQAGKNRRDNPGGKDRCSERAAPLKRFCIRTASMNEMGTRITRLTVRMIAVFSSEVQKSRSWNSVR